MHCGERYWFPQLIAVLPFRCSCLVGSSHSEVWQIKFEWCTLFLGAQFCSPLAALLWRWLFVWISALGAYFFALPPFSGADSVFCQCSPPPSVCYDSLLFVFSVLLGSLTLGAAHWLRRWAVWSATCRASGSGLLPTCSWPSYLSSICLMIVHTEISSLPLPFSLVHFQCSWALCCCARAEFTLCYSGFFGGFSLPRVCAGLFRGWLGNSEWCMVLTCLVCRMSHRQVWTQQRHLWQPSRFLCNMLWGRFPWAWGSCCQKFEPCWSFISESFVVMYRMAKMSSLPILRLIRSFSAFLL
jgi:hypothetical protein